MPDNIVYTPAELTYEVQLLSENYLGAVDELATDTEYFNDIGEAIVSKDGGEMPDKSEMANRIENIPTGGGTLISKTITENGVYNASSDNADGYDVVTVDVPERNTLDEYFSNTLEVANIPSATSIIADMFSGRTNLIDAIMPNVTSIGNKAFQNCTNLALTSLPSGVTSINEYIFQNCTNLALTSLPSGVTSINRYAFQNCTNLALTSLPSGVTVIGIGAFYHCTNLTLTSLPSGVTVIGNRVFEGCIGIPYLDFSNFTQIPTVETATFTGTTFPFYFRDQQQLDEWAATTNWSIYASRFQIKPSEVI